MPHIPEELGSWSWCSGHVSVSEGSLSWRFIKTSSWLGIVLRPATWLVRVPGLIPSKGQQQGAETGRDLE